MIEITIEYKQGYHNGMVRDTSITFNTENIEIYTRTGFMCIYTYFNKFPNLRKQEHYDHGNLIWLGIFDTSIDHCIGPHLQLWSEIIDDNGSQYCKIDFSNMLGKSITYEQFMQDCADNSDNELYQLFMKYYNDMLQLYNNIKK